MKNLTDKEKRELRSKLLADDEKAVLQSFLVENKEEAKRNIIDYITDGKAVVSASLTDEKWQTLDAEITKLEKEDRAAGAAEMNGEEAKWSSEHSVVTRNCTQEMPAKLLSCIGVDPRALRPEFLY